MYLWCSLLRRQASLDANWAHTPCAALSNWNGQRLYLALDTTVLWNRYCMIHLSVICGGRAIPFLWKVMEHKSSTVAFKEYRTMLKLSRRLLRKYPDVMLLADRGFANHQLINWLTTSQWHYSRRRRGSARPRCVVTHSQITLFINPQALCLPKTTETRILKDVTNHGA